VNHTSFRDRFRLCVGALAELARDVDHALDEQDTDARRDLHNALCAVGTKLSEVEPALDRVVQEELVGPPQPAEAAL
jgi:hypothetical protein